MRETDSNWFSRWEDQLPPPEDLMPLSQSLITPDLALAFNIPTHPPPQHSARPGSPAEFDSPALSGPGGGGSDESTRTLKRPRLVWTPQLHKRFVDAVAQLGIKNAVPKTIMQHMRVEGLTRENVASHLQKYRLYLKRMQSISTGGGGGPAASGVDSATDRLFASMPVPAHFLHPGRAGSDHYLPFVTPPAMQQHHHQMAAAAHHHHHPQLQQQFRHFGNGSPPNGQFEHAFMRQPSQIMGTPIHNSSNGPIVVPTYGEDLEPAKGKKVLTLFPTGDE